MISNKSGRGKLRYYLVAKTHRKENWVVSRSQRVVPEANPFLSLTSYQEDDLIFSQMPSYLLRSGRTVAGNSSVPA